MACLRDSRALIRVHGEQTLEFMQVRSVGKTMGKTIVFCPVSWTTYESCPVGLAQACMSEYRGWVDCARGCANLVAARPWLQ
eukprot:351853-Chlamydomonas_euryale.AAC.9